jgi:hypothetical protein
MHPFVRSLIHAVSKTSNFWVQVYLAVLSNGNSSSPFLIGSAG